MIKVLFFCSANQCRSPAAAGIFQSLVEAAGLGDRFWVESAGTHAAHGQGADPGTVRTAQRHGIDLADHRSRPLEASDGREFDLLVAMDAANVNAAREILASSSHGKVVRLLEGVPNEPLNDIPDPYRIDGGFEQVHQLLERGLRHLLEELRRKYALS